MKFYEENHKKRLIPLSILMVCVVALAVIVYFRANTSDQNIVVKSNNKKSKIVGEPNLETKEVISGLSHPWDMVFLPSGHMLFNERSGNISLFKNSKVSQVAQMDDVYAVGEGGLTGLALDSNFKSNRYLYVCLNSRNSNGIDVRVARFKLSKSETLLSDRKNIVTGIPSNSSGRHSGCRVRAASDGTLWVGTGDAAIASNPQDPKNLGGKILHVDREGKPVKGNLTDPFDPRIFSYGHRNVQGIALFEDGQVDGVYGYSVEHGSDRDDEVNLLKSGNFGWAPRVTYIETGIPMTDKKRFPDAISSIWSSGYPTIAPSGATIIRGNQWGKYSSALAMAVLKDKHVHLLKFDKNYNIELEKEMLSGFGRIRSIVQGPKGNLYLSTDNGSNDKIIKVTPKTD